MTPRQRRINELEENNAEFAKEILLNEAAIYEVEKEIAAIETELLEEPKIQSHIQLLRLLIERIEAKNASHREIIYQNNFEINSLENEKD
jgi:hypothetical protein